MYLTGQIRGVWGKQNGSTGSLVNQSEKGRHMTQPRENWLWPGKVSKGGVKSFEVEPPKVLIKVSVDRKFRLTESDDPMMEKRCL